MTKQIVLKLLRLFMGFIFLWAFLDKTFGLGFATKASQSWLKGGSPTSGFLLHGTKGPFVQFFHQIATMPYVDWVFMLGLLFIGATLIFNKYVKWGAIAGVIMLLLMYFSLLFPENNPFVDEHLIYALVLILLIFESDEY